MSTTGFSSLVETFFNAGIVAKTAPLILAAAWQTLAVGLLIVVTGVLAGILLASVRYATRSRVLRGLIVAYADIMRALPPLVLLILVYFALPYVDIAMGAVMATWLCLSLVLAAFIEECVWSGLCTTPPGQMEAARSTGMTWLAAMQHVVLPQAVRRVIPPLLSDLVSLSKDSGLISILGAIDAVRAAQIQTATYANFTPYVVAGVLFVLLTIPLTRFTDALARRGGWLGSQSGLAGAGAMR